MILNVKKLSLIVTLVGSAASAADGAAPAATNALVQCDRYKNIEIGAQLSKVWEKRFVAAPFQRPTPIESMSLGAKLRSEGSNYFESQTGAYWVGAALAEAGMIAAAQEALNGVLNADLEGKEIVLKEAALNCVRELHRKVPSLAITSEVIDGIVGLKPSELKDWALFRYAVDQNAYATALKGIMAGSPYAHAARAMNAVKVGDYNGAAKSFDKLFVQKEQGATFSADHWPKDLLGLQSYLRLLAGRTYFTMGMFKRSADVYSDVDKRSNELVMALTEQAWANLRGGFYSAAVGTTLSLQTGWLQSAFSPEGLMVMSMAFNEMCYYPESMRASQLIKEQYESSYDWLKANAATSSYNDLKAALNDKNTKIPARVRGEWIRSPAFLSRQGEMNEYLKLSERTKVQEDLARFKQGTKVTALLKSVKVLRKKFDKGARVQDLEADLESLRAELEEYEALKEFQPLWASLKSYSASESQARASRLTQEIGQHLKTTNQKLLTQLEDVFDNIKFIEVEVYQGATKDMIFTNANPGFNRKIEELKKKEKFQLTSNVMDWGKISTKSLGESEIWEDELGGFKANIPSKCEKKRTISAGGI